jgi:hypothetical protein
MRSATESRFARSTWATLRDCSDNCSADGVGCDGEHKTHSYNYNFMDAVLLRPRSQTARSMVLI